MKDFVLSPGEKQKLAPLLDLLNPEKTAGKKELVINRPGRAAYEDYSGNWNFFDTPNLDRATLENITRILADLNRIEYEVGNPNISLRLPGGHRGQVVGGDQTESGYSLTVRIHQEREFTLENYIMDAANRADLINAIKDRKTLLISGGTGSGKTSFLNAMLMHVPTEDRIVTLEDVRELKVPHENWVGLIFSNARGEARDGKSVNSLLNSTLRMRPDRIILGEIRKENAFTFCSAINTGHRGSMATIHANNSKAAIEAVINRVMLNGDIAESSLEVMRRQLHSDIDGVIQLERKPDGVHAIFEALK